METGMRDHQQPKKAALSRRDALRHGGVLIAGLAAACTPLRIVLHDYPRRFETDEALRERVLRAFALTVIPEADRDAPDLTRAFGDPSYPFAAYRAFFASDLSRRGADRFGEPAFDRLTQAQRTAVIEDGLRGDATTRKLYTGAIYLLQISYYAGIYDALGGCPLIGFDGAYRYRGAAAITYPDPERFLGASRTVDGNPL
jgi:hypothetical protein